MYSSAPPRLRQKIQTETAAAVRPFPCWDEFEWRSGEVGGGRVRVPHLKLLPGRDHGAALLIESGLQFLKRSVIPNTVIAISARMIMVVRRPPVVAASSLCRALAAPLQATEKSADFWSFCSPFSLSMMTSTLYLPFGQPEGGGEKV